MSTLYAQLDTVQSIVREQGGYIVSTGDNGYWHCLRDGDVLDILDGSADVSREELASYLADSQSMYDDLDEDDDSPVLRASDVAEYFAR